MYSASNQRGLGIPDHCGFLIANEVWKTMPHNPNVEPRHLPFVFQHIMCACTVLMRSGKLWWKLQPRRWLCLEHQCSKRDHQTLSGSRLPKRITRASSYHHHGVGTGVMPLRQISGCNTWGGGTQFGNIRESTSGDERAALEP